MSKVHVFDHPLIQHKLSFIRDKRTGSKDFRQLTNEVGSLMAYEITRDLPLEDVEVETPIQTTTCKRLAGKKVVFVPILRAGLGMVDGLMNLQPHEYFVKIPSNSEERHFIVVDPMLATGGSAIAAIDSLKQRGVTDIKFMCLIAAPEGVKALHDAHPDVDIFIAGLDEKLNDHGYIVPGLGDAGDRIFGTK